MPEDQKSGFSEAVETGASAAHTIRGAIKTGKAISSAAKVSFDQGKYIIQCLAQDAVEGKGDLVGVLNNRCFAIQNRNFGVRWRKGIGQSAENKTGEHENK